MISDYLRNQACVHGLNGNCNDGPFSNSFIIHTENTKEKKKFDECLKFRRENAHFCFLNFSF